jgi:GNAT superfamily N-acetyltransferase
LNKYDPNVDRFAASDGSGAALRRATSADADSVADVYLASFRHAYPDWPPVHTEDEVRGWIAGHLIPEVETWVAVEPDGSIVGLMALDGEDVDQLYVRPDRLGRGIGSRLIELAKQRRPQGLALFTFQVNLGARRFYERHGFVVERFGNGDSNEEHQPDVRYAWRAAAAGGSTSAGPGCR